MKKGRNADMVSAPRPRRQRILSLTLSVAALLMTARAGSIPDRPPYELLPVGAVKPQGWMLRQLQADLQTGITGHYDAIHANVANELFARQERKPGTREMGSRGLKEKAWWAGEHEGYWHDGLVRAAIQAESNKDLERIRVWVENILKRFDETGYIGIYSPDARFPDRGFDGELWAQSRAMEALFAWYDYTGDQRVLDAVSQTVRKTIDHYRDLGTYFRRPGQMDGGVTHAVGYMDTLETLWRRTGDGWFADAAVWLYEDYNKMKNADLQVDNMLDGSKPWVEHTPHTAESLHLPGIAGFFSGNEKFKRASQNVFPKLLRHTNPGGGFIAGKLEAIGGVIGGGDEANEYCSKTEAMITLGRLFQYAPDDRYGDWVERCALNAGQGARFHPANTGTIYLSRDNRLRADDPAIQGGREIVSAAHNCAACCTLNATRLLPSYVANMWYRSNQRPELLAWLYGASELETKIGATPVRIVQKTDYPFSDRVVFTLEPAEPVDFDLVLRVPPNSGSVEVVAEGAKIEKSEKTIRISKRWSKGDSVSVNFDFQIRRELQADKKQAFYEWGPLVFALPIEPVVTELEEIEKEGKKTGFFDFAVKAADPSPWKTLDDPGSRFAKIDLSDGDPLDPWAQPTVALEGTLKSFEGEPVEVRLLPMGSTLLRRTTFPLTKEAALEANKMHQDSIMRPEDDPMREF